MTFSLVIPDLFPDVAGDTTSGETPPDLPALTHLLAGSIDRSVESGWRAGLMRDKGWEQPATIAPAAVAAWALQPATAGPAAAFAQPVHQVAGLSRVHLHPAGLLKLDEAEATLLCETFNGELAHADMRLHRVGAGLLIVGALGRADDSGEAQEPGRYLGRELAAAGDRVAPALRRLGTEVEMWLHSHAVNRAREARGELPVNALWFWGAGPVVQSSAVHRDPTEPEVAYGDDPFLLGLWSALRGNIRPPVLRHEQVRELAACVVTGVASPRGAPTLQQLESDWFAPLRDAIDSRRLVALRLRIGTHCWNIRRRGMSRHWRRTKPWWEQFR